ncbi:MAG: VCBS repeat-containing protein, partial [Acidobacteriota bacterium]
MPTIPRRVFRAASAWAVYGLLGSAGWLSAQIFSDATAGSFPSPAPLEYTNQVSLGDVNGDGHLDIVFANGGGFDTPGPAEPQRIYINDGAGVFTDESAARLNWSGLGRGVHMGDIDRDGDLDLIFAQDFERLPRLFVNDGAGFYTDVTTAQLPRILLSSSRAQFGDIDNDGDLDLYLTAGQDSREGCDQYRIYVNDGAGFFNDETALRHPIEDLCFNTDAIYGDIDGDFDLDVMTASLDAAASRLYRNDGAGAFTRVATIPDGGGLGTSYDFGDIDGDGDLDLLGADNGQPFPASELLLRNDGDAVFTDISPQISPALLELDMDTKFLDYDDDGDLDLLLANLDRPIRTYENDGLGNFTQVAGIVEPIRAPTLGIAVGDLNGDRRPDIVTAQGEFGDFTNRIYLGGGAVDSRPPRIVATEGRGDTDDSAGPYVVRAAILD